LTKHAFISRNWVEKSLARIAGYISKNRKDQPLLTRETVVNLISNTSTRKGLKVVAVLDENVYEAGKEISDDELVSLNIHKDEFHQEWNCTIAPRCQRF
jgi:hypothetical protein